MIHRCLAVVVGGLVLVMAMSAWLVTWTADWLANWTLTP